MGILRRGAVLKKLNLSGGNGGTLRTLYTALFKACRILPDEAGRQNPFVLFSMLHDLSPVDKDDDRPVMSGHLRMFYGQ